MDPSGYALTNSGVGHLRISEEVDRNGNGDSSMEWGDLGSSMDWLESLPNQTVSAHRPVLTTSQAWLQPWPPALLTRSERICFISLDLRIEHNGASVEL